VTRYPFRRRLQAGVTLLELMVVVTLMVILSAAVTSAFVAGIDTERVYNRRQLTQGQRAEMERRITQLIQGAFLSEATTDRTTYFVGQNGNAGTAAGATTAGAATAGATGSSTATTSSATGSNMTPDGVDLGCDRLTFTTTAPGVPLAAQASADDFETQQQNSGPVGGISEVSLSTTAVGGAGDKTGLFERVQRPSDGDSTQGGTESVLSAEVQSIGFQFWNGTQWQTTWDSTGTETHHLPAAVLVSYTLIGDAAGTVHTLTISVLSSDVTAQNPITATAGSAAP
jgi:prepilin-type N-terminal cleavage/methylation domain-containing protein